VTREENRAIRELNERLLPWFCEHKREMPWRGEGVTPYQTWVSEIMLQQTRVEAVRSYFVRFTEALPDVYALAQCEEDRLLKLWEGLGYYSRVRNLQRAARTVVDEYGGELPRSRAELKKLSGIGDYTAGAICSIAYGLPEPAVDGNVLRVVSRLTGDERSTDEAAVRTEWTERLRAVYPDTHCGDFTQALMELGAIVCLPNGAPLCKACPMQEVCFAAKNCAWEHLPVRKAKAARKVIALTAFVVSTEQGVFLRKRTEQGVLRGTWEFPNVLGTLSKEQATAYAEAQGLKNAMVTAQSTYTHIFTHLEWHVTAYRVAGEGAWQGAVAHTPQELRDGVSVASAWNGAKELL